MKLFYILLILILFDHTMAQNDTFSDLDPGPIVFPRDEVIKSSTILNDGINEYLAWYDGAYAFLGNDTVNITAINGSLYTA